MIYTMRRFAASFVAGAMLACGCAQAQSGSLDLSYGLAGRALIGHAGYELIVTDVERQPDNKLLLATNLRQGAETEAWMVIRLTSSGELDSTFGFEGKVLIPVTSPGSVLTSIAIQSDGKILAAGAGCLDGLLCTGVYTGPAKQEEVRLLRLNSDGSLDTGFKQAIVHELAAVVSDVYVQPNAEILLLVNNKPRRFTADGVPDVHFNTEAISKYLNGNLTICASKVSPAGSAVRREAMAGTISTYGNQLKPYIVQSDGKMVFGLVSGDLVRFNADGSLDESFAVDSPDAINRRYCSSATKKSSFPIQVDLHGRIHVLQVEAGLPAAEPSVPPVPRKHWLVASEDGISQRKIHTFPWHDTHTVMRLTNKGNLAVGRDFTNLYLLTRGYVQDAVSVRDLQEDGQWDPAFQGGSGERGEANYVIGKRKTNLTHMLIDDLDKRILVSSTDGKISIVRLRGATATTKIASEFQGAWWGGAAQSGWGISVFVGSDYLVGAWFTFDSAGKPTWKMLNPCPVKEVGSICSGQVLSFSRSPSTYYDNREHKASIAGFGSLSISEESKGSWKFTDDYAKVEKDVFRMALGTGAKRGRIEPTGVWWGGAQERGWGLAIFEADQGLPTGVWYTHADDGSPVWYFLNGAQQLGDENKFLLDVNSPQQGTPFNSKDKTVEFKATLVGKLLLNLSDSFSGSIEFQLPGATQKKAIMRMNY